MRFGDWWIWMVRKYGKNHEGLSFERFKYEYLYGKQENNGNQPIKQYCSRVEEEEW